MRGRAGAGSPSQCSEGHGSRSRGSILMASSNPKDVPKVLPPDVTLGVGFQHKNLGGGGWTQTFSPQHLPSRFSIVSPGRVSCGRHYRWHKLEGFQQERYILSVLEASLKSRCEQGHAPSGGCGGGPFLPLPLLGAPGVPWLVAMSLHPLPPLPPGLPSISLCVLSSSYKKQAHVRAHPNPIRPPRSLTTHL